MFDYYQVLEVQKQASVSEIKKAYMRLALKWHPDKNPDNLDEANKKFIEISKAYEVLSNENKRRVYDQYRKDYDPNHHNINSINFGFGFEPFMFRDPEEVFREFLSFPIDLAYFRRHLHQDFTHSSLFIPHDFGLEDGFDNLFSPPNSSSTQFLPFSTLYGWSDPEMKKTSTYTRFINGKKIVTKKVIQNDNETVLHYENDILTYITVNGGTQAIKFS